jgi:L-threonate 2-dehydrogenase
MSQTIRRIAFVGLGAMGQPMAVNLVKQQYHVTGFDVRPAARQWLVDRGGHAAETARDAARDADALILMVVNAAQAEDVLFKDAALEGIRIGATIVLMATCAPDKVSDIARRVEGTGRHFIDAPVSGGVVGATAGTLTIMAAAPDATFQAAEPMLRTLGANLFHLGQKPGQGAAMKIVNQLLCGLHIVAAAEGLALAERSGIDPKRALEILSGSAAASWMLKDRGPRMVEDTGKVTSAVDIFVKDMGLVMEAGKAAHMGLPLAALAEQTFRAASGMGLGLDDDSQAIAVYRALARKA